MCACDKMNYLSYKSECNTGMYIVSLCTGLNHKLQDFMLKYKHLKHQIPGIATIIYNLNKNITS